MEYVLKNKKENMYLGDFDKIEKNISNAKIFKRKEASEKLNELANREEWLLSVIHKTDKILTEDEKIMNIIHKNHKHEFLKIVDKNKRARKRANAQVYISLLFFILSLAYFIYSVICFVR